MRSLRSVCGVPRKDRCRNSDVRDRCGLKVDAVTRGPILCFLLLLPSGVIITHKKEHCLKTGYFKTNLNPEKYTVKVCGTLHKLRPVAGSRSPRPRCIITVQTHATYKKQVRAEWRRDMISNLKRARFGTFMGSLRAMNHEFISAIQKQGFGPPSGCFKANNGHQSEASDECRQNFASQGTNVHAGHQRVGEYRRPWTFASAEQSPLRCRRMDHPTESPLELLFFVTHMQRSLNGQVRPVLDFSASSSIGPVCIDVIIRLIAA
ncbi:hypothetical protein EVAR_80325_1 [Eumeta japonica]|uniref:Uncharacterized protein n=1 Tax=Eumeta variegata TaxID=151549 RepID=A0A4C1X2J9_EUMVA|nr:hypothetical protein EVAR_80325_1 [Eumeta japonica]